MRPADARNSRGMRLIPHTDGAMFGCMAVRPEGMQVRHLMQKHGVFKLDDIE